MKTLEEIKKDIANSYGYDRWHEFFEIYHNITNDVIDEIARTYANQAIDLCADKAEAYANCSHDNGDGILRGMVNKQSILNVKELLR